MLAKDIIVPPEMEKARSVMVNKSQIYEKHISDQPTSTDFTAILDELSSNPPMPAEIIKNIIENPIKNEEIKVVPQPVKEAHQPVKGRTGKNQTFDYTYINENGLERTIKLPLGFKQDLDKINTLITSNPKINTAKTKIAMANLFRGGPRNPNEFIVTYPDKVKKTIKGLIANLESSASEKAGKGIIENELGLHIDSMKLLIEKLNSNIIVTHIDDVKKLDTKCKYVILINSHYKLLFYDKNWHVFDSLCLPLTKIEKKIYGSDCDQILERPIQKSNSSYCWLMVYIATIFIKHYD